MVPWLGSFSKLIIFQRGKNKNKKPSRLIKRAWCSWWGRQNLKAWLILSFNYPVHLVSCDPGLREVICDTKKSHGSSWPTVWLRYGKWPLRLTSPFTNGTWRARLRVWCVGLRRPPNAPGFPKIHHKKVIMYEKLAGQPAFVMAHSLEQTELQNWKLQVMYLEHSPWEVTLDISTVVRPLGVPYFFLTSAVLHWATLGFLLSLRGCLWDIILRQGEKARKTHPLSASLSLRLTCSRMTIVPIPLPGFYSVLLKEYIPIKWYILSPTCGPFKVCFIQETREMIYPLCNFRLQKGITN